MVDARLVATRRARGPDRGVRRRDGLPGRRRRGRRGPHLGRRVALRLPARRLGGRHGRGDVGVLGRAARLGARPGPRAPRARRAHRVHRDRPALHPARQRDRAADPGLHAVPHRAGDARAGAGPGADGPRRRAVRARPRRDRPRVRRRRGPAGADQPAQPHGPRVRRRRARRGDRGGRAPRRAGLQRRDPRAPDVRRPPPPALRRDVGGRRGAHRHRDLGVQGLEHPGAQVRAGDPVERRRRRALGGHRLPRRARHRDARGAGDHRGLPRRPGLARRRARLPGRQPRPARRRPTCRGSR